MIKMNYTIFSVKQLLLKKNFIFEYCLLNDLGCSLYQKCIEDLTVPLYARVEFEMLLALHLPHKSHDVAYKEKEQWDNKLANKDMEMQHVDKD